METKSGISESMTLRYKLLGYMDLVGSWQAYISSDEDMSRVLAGIVGKMGKGGDAPVSAFECRLGTCRGVMPRVAYSRLAGFLDVGSELLIRARGQSRRFECEEEESRGMD